MPIISCFPTKVENDDRYLRLIGGQMQGNLDMDSHAIQNVAAPVNDGDAANKEYVDNEITIALVGNYVPMSAKGEASGVAELDETGKVPSTQLPAMDYVPNSSVGAAGGVAELDSSGRVPQAQLPSYVDDVVEYASQSAFPETGEAGKIYVALDTNLTYRWGGSEYVEISPSLALGETESTAYRGDRGKAAYDHSQVTRGNPHGTTATDVGAMPAVPGGSNGQILTRTADGAEWKDAPDTGVVTFNGRMGTVAPQAGDYTAAMVGARPDTWTPSAFDVGALTQAQGDARYIVMNGGGTAQMDAGLGNGPFIISFDEETEGAPILTFGAQSVATSAWTADTTYEGYGFRAAVPLSGVTADYVPSVTFGVADATDGNLAPVADTYAGGVYVYAKETPSAAVSILSVMCAKGA